MIPHYNFKIRFILSCTMCYQTDFSAFPVLGSLSPTDDPKTGHLANKPSQWLLNHFKRFETCIFDRLQVHCTKQNFYFTNSTSLILWCMIDIGHWRQHEKCFMFGRLSELPLNEPLIIIGQKVNSVRNMSGLSCK